MIEAAHAVRIETPIAAVWDYVQHIEQWANLFPGFQNCELVDADNSRWVLKVGAGGMVRTVTVLVRVDEWAGPERVEFSFSLAQEPVVGSGQYLARSDGANASEITMQIRVEGSGSMAPMWEAMSKPLLPQLAKSFAGQLKTEIEARAGVLSPPAATSRGPLQWLANLFHRVRGLFTAKQIQTQTEHQSGAQTMLEDNKAVVLKFIEAMGCSDGATAADCLAPDAYTLAKGFGKFAGVRKYDTIIGTIDAFNKLLPTGLRPEIKTVTAEGERVVVEFEGNAVTCDGQPYENEYCMVFTLRDGKIRQVNEYFCTIRAEEVLWPLVAAMSDEIPAS